MTWWRVTNLDTTEVRYVQTYNNVWACEMCGWRLSHCDCQMLKTWGQA